MADPNCRRAARAAVLHRDYPGAVTSVPPVLSERLELASMSLPLIQALLERDLHGARRHLDVELTPELADDTHVLLLRRDQLLADPAVAPWLLRVMVPREGPRRAIGRIGFHGPPDADGRVEVGYTVLPEHRGMGFATEASRALFAWARETHGIARFRASVSPTNTPSLAVVRKLGLVQTGVQWDEIDGEELVFDSA
jgi:RimJ/RimL family protein N-acetyltransferase